MRREWIEIQIYGWGTYQVQSPSMRREWIEMTGGDIVRNVIKSPSMRREWIEMQSWTQPCRACLVSLHAEGVD